MEAQVTIWHLEAAVQSLHHHLPERNRKMSHRSFLKAFAAMLMVLVLISGCGTVPAGSAPTEPVATSPAAVATLPAQETLPPTVSIAEGWIALSEPELGYQLAYAPDWELSTTTPFSRVFSQSGAEGPSFPVFYVTVAPNGFTNAQAEAYNFVAAETLQGLWNQAIGSSAALDGNPDYSTFARLENTSVNGRDAVVIENSRVWEGGQDTKDRRVIILGQDKVYMLGTYYDSPDDLENFQKALDTFRILE
jgi:hypothetical protein